MQSRAGRARWAALVVAVLLCGSAQAQYPGRHALRSVVGTVTDRGGEPLAGAVVQLETGGTLAIQTYLTRADGEYRFRNLQGDADYTMWATFRGSRSKTRSLSRFDRKPDRVVPLKIRLQ